MPRYLRRYSIRQINFSFCVIAPALYLALSIGCASARGQVAQTVQAGPSFLEVGKPAERLLKGTETHSYVLQLHAGQCAVIQVEQRGINVGLQLMGKDNQPVLEVDDEIGKQGIEKFAMVAESDGTYKVEVKPKLKIASGSYEIQLLEVR